MHAAAARYDMERFGIVFRARFLSFFPSLSYDLFLHFSVPLRQTEILTHFEIHPSVRVNRTLWLWLERSPTKWLLLSVRWLPVPAKIRVCFMIRVLPYSFLASSPHVFQNVRCTIKCQSHDGWSVWEAVPTEVDTTTIRMPSCEESTASFRSFFHFPKGVLCMLRRGKIANSIPLLFSHLISILLLRFTRLTSMCLDALQPQRLFYSVFCSCRRRSRATNHFFWSSANNCIPQTLNRFKRRVPLHIFVSVTFSQFFLLLPGFPLPVSRCGENKFD